MFALTNGKENIIYMGRSLDKSAPMFSIPLLWSRGVHNSEILWKTSEHFWAAIDRSMHVKIVILHTSSVMRRILLDFGFYDRVTWSKYRVTRKWCLDQTHMLWSDEGSLGHHLHCLSTSAGLHGLQGVHPVCRPWGLCRQIWPPRNYYNDTAISRVTLRAIAEQRATTKPPSRQSWWSGSLPLISLSSSSFVWLCGSPTFLCWSLTPPHSSWSPV